jgi:hypothetical protein
MTTTPAAARARHNSATDLREASQHLSRAARVYAVLFEWATPPSLREPVRRVATAAVSGRRFWILTTGRAQRAALTTAQGLDADSVGCERPR